MITISGDRQTGKTHLLLDIAARDLALGKRVVYVARTRQLAQNAQIRFLDRHFPESGCRRITRRIDEMRVHSVQDGMVAFLSGGSIHGVSADTYLFDDIDPARLQELVYMAGRYSAAARIYGAPMAYEPRMTTPA